MKNVLWLALVFAGSLSACDQGPNDREAQVNVNSRYTVESVNLTGYRASRISPALRNDLDKLVGEKLNHSLLDRMSTRIKKELHVEDVTIQVRRGSEPEHVTVNFEIQKTHQQDFDISVPKLVYSSRQGFSSAVDATTRIQGNDFTFGLVSDSDERVERFAGFKARFERKEMGTDRLQLSFEFDSYHQQWNNATRVALDSDPTVPGIYRSRQEFSPMATVVLAEPLTFSTGVAFDRFLPDFPAAKTESANAVVNSLRYHQRWEDSANKQEVDAGYSLRAATRALQSDFVYVKHFFNARYVFRRDHSRVDVSFLAGHISGQAPLFERFVLGNSATLRGWNKFDIDPLGGDKMVHGSVEYQYRWFDVFYDTGSVWDRRTEPEQKQSLGVGLKKDGFLLAVAFPIRNGRADPIFIAGTSF